jgi:4'-phosphopantetheinyl transferase EntD
LFGPDVSAGASPVVANLDDLFPDERVAIAAWTLRRQYEFATGRVCARSLLARVGVGLMPLLMGAGGRPLWPPGFVGAISHTDGLCVGAVARSDSVAGVGIDVEVADGLDETMWDLVCTPSELNWLRRQEDAARARLLATALFSAKESAYKCVASEGTGSFEPRDIEVDWDGKATFFSARVMKPGPTTGSEAPHDPAALIGTLLVRRRWVLTGVVSRRTSGEHRPASR